MRWRLPACKCSVSRPWWWCSRFISASAMHFWISYKCITYFICSFRLSLISVTCIHVKYLTLKCTYEGCLFKQIHQIKSREHSSGWKHNYHCTVFTLNEGYSAMYHYYSFARYPVMFMKLLLPATISLGYHLNCFLKPCNIMCILRNTVPI